MSKTSFTTKANSVLLATVLVAGIIALSYPSFMIGAQAQQFNGMDQRYNNHEPEYGMDQRNNNHEPEYGMDQRYNNHEPEYGQDNKYNSYEPQYGTDYGMNSYEKKPYEKDNSYDKSKDSSVIVKKVKCHNWNWNFNLLSGNEISTSAQNSLGALANEAQAEDEGENGANFGNNGREGGDGRSSGHDSDSKFICINNNNNEGDKKDKDDKDKCAKEIELCFKDFLGVDFSKLVTALGTGITINVVGGAAGETVKFLNFEDICKFLQKQDRLGLLTQPILQHYLFDIIDKAGIDLPVGDLPDDFLKCVVKALGIDLEITIAG